MPSQEMVLMEVAIISKWLLSPYAIGGRYKYGAISTDPCSFEPMGDDFSSSVLFIFSQPYHVLYTQPNPTLLSSVGNP